MDDELENPGLSGWAGFQLGRISAERDRHTSETMDVMFKRCQPALNVNAIIAQNDALETENMLLRQALSEYEVNYLNLKAWANRAETRINELLKERG